MEVSRRRLRPNEIDHELIWLTISLGSLAGAATWRWFGLPWPECAFHTLTGFPCLACGATRCAIEFFHGHFLSAMRWNPLVFIALYSLSIFDAYAFAVLIFHIPRIRIAQLTAADKNFTRAATIGLFAINWIYLLANWQRY
jgi:hypothetical protein